MQPLVSVIVPVHNDEEYLRECLDSILGQSLRDIEIICVDDGSEDRSADILRGYESRTDNVCCLFHDVSMSAAKARKDGVLASSGKYVMFVDGDDFLSPDACLHAYNAICAEGTDIVQFDTVVENCGNLPEGRIASNQKALKPYVEKRLEGHLLEECFFENKISVGLWNKIFEGNICRKAFRYVEDGVFPKANDLYALFFLLNESESFSGLNEPLYHYCFGRGMTGHQVMTMENFQRNCQGVQVVKALRRFVAGFAGEEAARLAAVVDKIQSRLMSEQCGRWLRNLAPACRKEGFQYLCSLWEGAETAVLTSLAGTCFYNRVNAAEALRDLEIFQYTPRKIRTVAFYYRSIYNGGAQRVVAQLCNLFADQADENGYLYNVVLITDEVYEYGEYQLSSRIVRETIPSKDESRGKMYPVRAKAWHEILDKHNIDVVLDSWWADGITFWDMVMIKSHATHPAVVIHTHSWCGVTYRMENLPQEMRSFYGMADGMVTLSECDQEYWKTVNTNTFFVENPCYLMPAGDHRAKWSNKSILWIARISREKQPLEIVRIMQRVVKEVPTAICRIVGDGDEELLEEIEQSIEEAGLAQNVLLEGFHEDVGPFYEKASVLVMTSRYEGFPLTAYESASYGVPTITYDIPWLSYYDMMKGYINVPQRDAERAAEEIIRLLRDQSFWEEQSDLLYESFLRYKQINIFAKWKEVIQSLETERIGTDCGMNRKFKIILDQIAEFHSQGVARVRGEVNARLRQAYAEKSELNAKLQQTYAEKSEINAKLQRTYAEKSELNAKLQRTYAEKSELNAKLQQAYKEKAERGIMISEKDSLLKEQAEKIEELNEQLASFSTSLSFRLGRALTWLPRKIRRRGN